MKLFGWGRRKDPPQPIQQIKNSGAALHYLCSNGFWMRCHCPPCIGGSNLRWTGNPLYSLIITGVLVFSPSHVEQYQLRINPMHSCTYPSRELEQFRRTIGSVMLIHVGLLLSTSILTHQIQQSLQCERESQILITEPLFTFTDLKYSHGPITGVDRKGVHWGNEFRNTSSPHPFEDRVQHRNLKHHLQAAYNINNEINTFHKAGGNCNDCGSEDEKLQETIRFVFTHEREGLLAIGTFALDQLAGVRNALEENHHHKGADLQLFGPGFDTLSCGGRLVSETYNENVDIDDEDQTCHQRRIPGITSGKKYELPVFGDHQTESTEMDHHKTSECNRSKALAPCKGNGRRSPNGLRPIVLLTALPSDFKKLDPALYSNNTPKLVPHWLESVPPPMTSAVKEDASFSDDEYYSTSMCGLFTTKKKFPTGDNKAVNCDQANSKKTLTKPGCKSTTLGKLGQLWRSTCKSTTCAKVAPEIRTSPARSLPENNGSTVPTFAQRSPTSLLANLQRCPPSKPQLSSKAQGPPSIANRTERNERSSATRCTPVVRPPGVSSPITGRHPPGNNCRTLDKLISVSSTPITSPSLGSQCATLPQPTSNISISGAMRREETKEKPTLDEPIQREPSRRDNHDEIPQPRDGKWIKTDSEFVVLEM